jgi:hypothetical protein
MKTTWKTLLLAVPLSISAAHADPGYTKFRGLGVGMTEEELKNAIPPDLRLEPNKPTHRMGSGQFPKWVIKNAKGVVVSAVYHSINGVVQELTMTNLFFNIVPYSVREFAQILQEHYGISEMECANNMAGDPACVGRLPTGEKISIFTVEGIGYVVNVDLP